MFNEFAQDYFDKNIQVCPLRGKIPFINNWQIKSFEGTSYPNCNIGLKTGEPSGIICIDIDTTDEQLKQEIYSQLPPLFSGKIGNKNKGINYFFKFNGEQNRKFGGVVELLSTGNQTVLPPSIHPETNYAYQWMGKTLLEIDVDDLPYLPHEFISWCEKKFKSEITYSTEGRHNTLVSIAGAMVGRNEPIQKIIDELVEYDNTNHSPPYFTDQTEAHKGKGYSVAINMVNSVINTQQRKGIEYNPQELRIEFIEKKPEFKKQRIKLPNHRGLLGELFDHTYKVSTIPRSRMSWASSLVTFGTILANKVTFRNSYTNIYALLVVDSGGGKDIPLKTPHEFLFALGMTPRIGETDIVSDNSILLDLEENKNKLIVLDEAADLLSSAVSTNNFMARVGKVLTVLWSSAGSRYGGKKAHKFISKANPNGVVGECFSPCVSLFGATTFRDIETHATIEVIEKGLGGRFLYFPEDEIKYANLDNQFNRTFDESLIKRTQQLHKTYSGTLFSGTERPLELGITSNAWKMINEIYNDEIKSIIDSNRGTKLAPVAHRLQQNMIKMMMIDHCSLHPDKVTPIKTDSVIWSFNAIKQSFALASELLTVHVSENTFDRDQNKILSALNKNNGSLTRTEMCRKIKISAKNRDEALKNLIESKIIGKIKESNCITYYLIDA